MVIVPPASESFAKLTITPEPADARIRILNIIPPYAPGMQLMPDRYHIEVSAPGYATKTEWIELGDQEKLDINIALSRDKTLIPGKSFTDPSTGMEFVYVKGGCYQMGDTFGYGYDSEKPVHEVCVNRFWLGKYEVTQGEWQKIMGDNPSYFQKGDNYPVETVSWFDVQQFIRKLNKKSHRKYRLPTEAEWEFTARRGGKKDNYAGSDNADFVAWYTDNSGETHAVGTKQVNGFGFYDMSGNVMEWCSDWYSRDYYKTSPRNNPQGPPSGSNRVIRGGGWRNSPRRLRAAGRFGSEPGYRIDYLGFRLALPPGQ